MAPGRRNREPYFFSQKEEPQVLLDELWTGSSPSDALREVAGLPAGCIAI
ncbi:MAG: hypothetical protein ACYDH2_05400 [Anaerolineaceae bacterium]